MKTSMTFAALTLSCLPAFAMGAGVSDVDANGDGVLTIDEVQAAYPEVDTDAFTAMDLDASGTLDETEVSAAQEAGMMPTEDG